MIKIEAITLEKAYSDAASELGCSVTELNIEVVQYPSSGLLGLFRKKAIIVATKKVQKKVVEEKKISEEKEIEVVQEGTKTFVDASSTAEIRMEEENIEEKNIEEENIEEEIERISKEEIGFIKEDLQKLFDSICFELDEIQVKLYDKNTLYVELNGTDAALLIGKEGYRYKALSYMIFNWINAKYDLQLRLEIAEFLKNQEEAVNRYLESVKENVDRDGRAQTKILDGVLVQIALRELRATYPDKYVAIRTTRDGLKYIIINDYNY